MAGLDSYFCALSTRCRRSDAEPGNLWPYETCRSCPILKVGMGNKKDVTSLRARAKAQAQLAALEAELRKNDIIMKAKIAERQKVHRQRKKEMALAEVAMNEHRSKEVKRAPEEIVRFIVDSLSGLETDEEVRRDVMSLELNDDLVPDCYLLPQNRSDRCNILKSQSRLERFEKRVDANAH